MTESMSSSHSSLKIDSKTQNHAVIILASGLSQRLGQPKQLLKKDSKPLIHYMLELALATNPKLVVVIIPKQNLAINSAMETIIDKLAPQNPTLQIVANPNPETGMAQSLSLGIEAITNSQHLAIDRVLIMGIDQVQLDLQHLKQLLAENNTVVASSYPHLAENFAIDKLRDNIIGLPIAIDFDLLKKWQSSLSGDKGLRHLLRGLSTRQMSTVSNSQLSYDIDTPEQFTYAKRQSWLDP